MSRDFAPDLLDAAMNPVEPTYSNEVYGQIEFDLWFCALIKGTGKVPYDANAHKPGQRRTVIDINIADLGGYNYHREFIAEIATDGWLGVTHPSLVAIGVTDLRALHGAWIKAEMVKYKTYKKSDGTEGTLSAPKVLAIYPDREACEAAAQAADGSGSGPDWLVGANGNGHANGQPSSSTANDAERAVALQFLPAIVKSAVRGNGIDLPTLEAALKGNPILAKYFTTQSPEVLTAIQAALAEPAF